MHIALPIEWISRELDSKLLLICHLIKNSKKKKLKILFGSQKLLGKFLLSKKFSPFVWVASGVDQQQEAYFNLIKNGGVFTSLDEEGGIFTKHEEENFPRHLRGIDNAKFITRLYIWGKKEFHKFKKNYKRKSKKTLVLSGNPSFDLASTKYKKYHFSRNKKVNVLINSAFGTGNSDISFYDEKLFCISRSISYKFYDKFGLLEPIYKYQKKNFYPFLSDIKKLVTKYPKVIFGLRCHPAENILVYKNFFSNIKNMRILDNSQSVLYNIFNSDILIHNGCTTAIENSISNKISICHINFRNKKYEQYLPVKISHNSSNFLELDKLFCKYIKKNHNTQTRYKKILHELKGYISNLNNSSSGIISKNLLSIKLKNELQLKRNLIHNKEKQRDWFFQIKRKFLKIFFFIKISNIHKLIKLREKRKFYPISKALIEYKLNKLLKINNCNSLFRVTVLKKDTFLIEKK